jgi:hypothetical protein
MNKPEVTDDELWDYYSGLPNPMWYQRVKELDDEEHRKKIKESLKKVGHPKPSSKKCSINGLTFNSAVEASKHFNMPDSSVRDRIRNKNFPTWIWLE